MKGELFENADISIVPKTGLVIIGLSGGADSIALTHFLMNKIDKSRILCAHVNHGLRGEEADKDEVFAKAFCERYELRFALLRADVAKAAQVRKIGLEECGRQVRYEFFESLIEDENSSIATAHNANDNAETMLMNLAKGAGLQGVSGIPAVRGRLIRPLLKISRDEIEEYCSINALIFVTDSTNNEDEYMRNRVRHKIMPILNEVNPQAVAAMSQAAERFRRDWDFISHQAQELIKSAECEYGLNINILNDAHIAVLSAALKIFFEQSGCGRLSEKHINEAVRCVRENSSLTIPGKLSVQVSQGVLSLNKAEEVKAFEREIFEGENELTNGKSIVLSIKSGLDIKNFIKINNLLFKNSFDYDTITNVLVSRSRKEGDKFTLAGRNVTKSIKKLFNEMKIPVQIRDEIILIESAGKIVFVEGAGVCEEFKVTPKTKRIAIIDICRRES